MSGAKPARQNTMDYSEYTIPVSDDPSLYGSSCTQEDATRIAEALAQIIRDRFPGITVARHSSVGSGKVTGPDESTCDTIRNWVQENWTAAL